jgi:hypothetical protein
MSVKLLITLSLLVFLFTGCGSPSQDNNSGNVLTNEAFKELSEKERAFMNNIATLCGQSFYGREVYVQPGRESWANKILFMSVALCEDSRIHIPFHIDDDKSRTWMLMTDKGKLRFRHDHRHEDGTPEDQTLYGGYSDGSGDAFKQYFPADDYTRNLLTDTLERQWNIVLSEDLSKMSYQLQYRGEIVFMADFDLTSPIVNE